MRPDRDLDRELKDLGARIEYPPTPDLARSVRGRLEAENDPATPNRTRPQLWWIAAAALVLLVALPVASISLRDIGGGAFSGGAGDVAVEQEARDAGPTRSVGDDGSLAAGEGAASSRAADSGASAEAACAWPEPALEARPPRGAPGEVFGVRGRYFEADVRDCDDDPARRVRVEFLQRGRTWGLGSVEVTRGSRLNAELEVPADAGPGRATVRVSYEQRTPEDPRGKTSVEAPFFVTG